VFFVENQLINYINGHSKAKIGLQI